MSTPLPPLPQGADHQSLCFKSTYPRFLGRTCFVMHQSDCVQGCSVFFKCQLCIFFVIELEEILVNDKIRAASQSNNFVTQALYQKLKTSKWTLKTVRLTGLQKSQLKSVSIFFKFVHLCLLLYLHCYNLYLLFMFWAVFLCLQWVLSLFDAGGSLGIKDEIILCLLHKILWLMFSCPWLLFIKTRSLFQIFASNVANFSYYQNSMATLLM